MRSSLSRAKVAREALRGLEMVVRARDELRHGDAYSDLS